ncbi:MAG: hypothetical protein Ct9H300mP32_3080 [Verrucomicrobiota bacterium]|nr:MAG: hypothetical protein Ct9H300mP32_3080 [Verrucomicrobiota bacterium]
MPYRGSATSGQTMTLMGTAWPTLGIRSWNGSINLFSAIRLKSVRGLDGVTQLHWQAKPHRVYQLQGKRRLAANVSLETVKQFLPVLAPADELRVTPLDQFQSQSGFFRLHLAGDQ